MKNNKVHTVRYQPQNQKTDFSDYKLFSFKGTVLKITDTSIRVTRGESKAAFWLDLGERKDCLPIDVEEGSRCWFEVNVQSFIGKNDFRYKTKIVLTDIHTLEEGDTIEETSSDMNLFGLCKSTLKTEIPGLYIVEVQRRHKDKDLKETYHVRYYNPEKKHPDFLEKEVQVTFRIENSSKIVLSNGDVYSDVEEWSTIKDNVEYKNKAVKYYPILNALRVMW